MLSLTPDHFETSSHPASSDNLRRPFFEWVDIIEAVQGSAVAGAMINDLAAILPGDPGGYLWTETPFCNYALFQLLLAKELSRGTPWGSGERSNGMVVHASSSE